MAALEAAHRQLVRFARRRLDALQRAFERQVDGSGAADRDLVVVFRIAVDEELRVFQIFRIQRDRARHAALLVRRDNEAQRAVLFRVLHEVDALGDTDAVIRAEARAVRREVFLRAHELDRVRQRVVVHALRADGDHVHVTLQDRARRVFMAFGRRLVRDDVVLRVLHDGEARVRQILLQEIADGLLVTVRARDRREFFEFLEHAFQNIHN